jgi:hypothetical protein
MREGEGGYQPEMREGVSAFVEHIKRLQESRKETDATVVLVDTNDLTGEEEKSWHEYTKLLGEFSGMMKAVAAGDITPAMLDHLREIHARGLETGKQFRSVQIGLIQAKHEGRGRMYEWLNNRLSPITMYSEMVFRGVERGDADDMKLDFVDIAREVEEEYRVMKM